MQRISTHSDASVGLDMPSIRKYDVVQAVARPSSYGGGRWRSTNVDTNLVGGMNRR